MRRASQRYQWHCRMSMGNVRRLNEFPLIPTLSHRERELLAPAFLEVKRSSHQTRSSPYQKCVTGFSDTLDRFPTGRGSCNSDGNELSNDSCKGRTNKPSCGTFGPLSFWERVRVRGKTFILQRHINIETVTLGNRGSMSRNVCQRWCIVRAFHYDPFGG
jgi:hypothetical protein